MIIETTLEPSLAIAPLAISVVVPIYNEIETIPS